MTLSTIAQRADRIGVRADRVLIAEGLVAEETYLIELAAALGVAFEPLENVPREACPTTDDRLVEAAITGLLPLLCRDGLKIVVAPSLTDSRRLVQAVASDAHFAQRIRVTSPARLLSFVATHGSAEIGRRAVDGIRADHPELSAGPGRRRFLGLTITVAVVAVAALLAPGPAAIVLEIGLGVIFLAWTGLRLAGMMSHPAIGQRPSPHADDGLPVYTIVVALYREARAIKGLVTALRQINYPREKLDIKLVLEADDCETREALTTMRLAAPFEIITAPAIGPRTKPKALNVALPFARGTFTAVYDAEDRPEPDQLRLALEAFAAGDHRLACVQARLTIDNSGDSWLTRLFTAEYASLFDVLLPGLSEWRLPLPLGGSSNHFRTSVLCEVGAWDPYNVTEDADLGMRLARFGYRSAVIASTTYEEAPARLKPWLKQRTRWFKGWMRLVKF